MQSTRHCLGLVCLIGLALPAGCSKDSHPPAESEQVASPNTAPPRVYAALPSEMLRDALGSGMTCTITDMELALQFNDLATARARYEALLQDPACGARTRVLFGCRLVELFLRKQPALPGQADKLVGQLTATAAQDSSPAVRDLLSWWTAILRLHQGDNALAVDAAAWEAYRKATLASLASVSGPCPALASVVGAMSRAAQHAVKLGPDAVDRIEQLIVDVQVAVPAPDMLVSLQRQRVDLLRLAGRQAEARYEARILLALSAADVSAWVQNVTWVEDQFRQDGAADLAGRVAAFARSGPDGPDAVAGNGDDLADPLVQTTRQYAPLQDKLAGPSPATGLRLVYALLLTGRGSQAAACLEQLRQKVQPTSDAEGAAILQAVVMARALQDGHALGCDQPLRLLAAPAAARIESDWLWANLAQRLLQQRAQTLAALAPADDTGLILAAYRPIVDADASADRLGVVFSACQTLARDRTLTAQQERFRQFRGLLQNSAARLAAARFAAEQWLTAGNVSAALAELDAAAQVDPAGDIETLLLRAGCLIGLGKTSDATACVDAVLKSTDLTCDRLARANLVRGAILVQQGRIIEARQALDRIGQLAADTKYKTRAKSMLDKL